MKVLMIVKNLWSPNISPHGNIHSLILLGYLRKCQPDGIFNAQENNVLRRLQKFTNPELKIEKVMIRIQMISQPLQKQHQNITDKT